MAVQQRDRRHGVGEEAVPEGEEARAEEGGVFDGVVVVEAVGVEFWDGAGGYHDALWETVFEDVEG